VDSDAGRSAVRLMMGEARRTSRCQEEVKTRPSWSSSWQRTPSCISTCRSRFRFYKKASDARRGLKVVIYFSAAERKLVIGILKELKRVDDPDVVLIDARKDNKPSGSKA
jgi:hypothetical protein